jgi:hypothetical protein
MRSGKAWRRFEIRYSGRDESRLRRVIRGGPVKAPRSSQKIKETAMSTKAVRINDPNGDAGVARVKMKFEVVVIPVADVDRAKEFYSKLGWRLDADYDSGKDFRVVSSRRRGRDARLFLERM